MPPRPSNVRAASSDTTRVTVDYSVASFTSSQVSETPLLLLATPSRRDLTPACRERSTKGNRSVAAVAVDHCKAPSLTSRANPTAAVTVLPASGVTRRTALAALIAAQVRDLVQRTLAAVPNCADLTDEACDLAMAEMARIAGEAFDASARGGREVRA